MLNRWYEEPGDGAGDGFTTIETSGTGETVINSATAPTATLKGLTAGTNITLTSATDDITIATQWAPLTAPVSLVAAAGWTNYTTGTVNYMIQPVNVSTIVSGLRFLVQAYTSSTVWYFGIYSYAGSGTVTRLGTGNVTVTSTGAKTITFSSPVTLTKGTDVTIAWVRVSGESTLFCRTSAPSTTELAWTGATSQSSLPSTDSTARSALTNWPFIDWIYS